MQFSHALIAFVAAGLANALDPTAFPSCSYICFNEVLRMSNCGANLMNFQCECQQKGLTSVLAGCIDKGCSPTDQAIVSKAVESLCSSAGYPVTYPPISGLSTPAASSTAASTSAVSMPPCPGMSSASATYTSSPAPASSVAPAPTSSAMVSTPMASSAMSSTPMTPSTAASSTPNPSPTFNAAANVKGGLAGVAAAAAAVAYML